MENVTYFLEKEAMGDPRDILERLVSLCPDGIIGVDRGGIISIFNQAAERLTGWSAAEAVGKLHISNIYGSTRLARDIKKAIYSPGMGGAGRLEGLEASVKNRWGVEVPIHLSAVVLFQGEEEVGSVGFFHDMTQRKKLEEDLRRLSITDSLTGLFNRRHFHHVLAQEVARSQRYGRPLCLAIFDLDNFKPFNDNFGHQEGDNILRLTAECTRQSLRGQDMAFRYGGDEFALVFVETDMENGALAAERFRRTFNDSWPMAMNYLNGSMRPVTLSLGVACHKPGESPENLVARADLAMYEAKKSGGDRTMKASARISDAVESGSLSE